LAFRKTILNRDFNLRTISFLNASTEISMSKEFTQDQINLKWITEIKNKDNLNDEDLKRIWILLNNESIVIRNCAKDVLSIQAAKDCKIQKQIILKLLDISQLTILEQLCFSEILIQMCDYSDTQDVLKVLNNLPSSERIY
jgi:hypothetical protein